METVHPDNTAKLELSSAESSEVFGSGRRDNEGPKPGAVRRLLVESLRRSVDQQAVPPLIHVFDGCMRAAEVLQQL